MEMEKALKLLMVFRSSFTSQFNTLQNYLAGRNFINAKVTFKILERERQRLHKNDEDCNAMLDDNNLSEEGIEKEMATAKANEFKFE